MALIVCPECKNEVSDTNKMCIKCGYRFPKQKKKREKMSTRKKVAICITIFSVLALIGGGIVAYYNFSPKTVSWLCKHNIIAATCEEPSYCVRCGTVFERALGHSMNSATCTEPATCGRCGETDGVPLGHSWSNATCTAPRRCSRCSTTDGEPLGHNYRDATCTSARRCTRCNATTGAPLGHHYVDYICTRCGVSNVGRNDVPN